LVRRPLATEAPVEQDGAAVAANQGRYAAVPSVDAASGLGRLFGASAVGAVNIKDRLNLVAVEQVGRALITFFDKDITYALPVLEFSGSGHSQRELINL
jgi:hypothetical protein